MKSSKILPIFFLSALMLSQNSIADEQTREAAEQELEEVQAYIEKYDLDWTAGLTSRVLNYTREERPYGLKLPDDWRSICEQHLPPTSPNTWFDEFPESFNWEDSGKVTPVRNQGPCGSCWIFSATAALEAEYFIYRDQPMDLSEQAVLSCLSYGWGCNGGWPEEVFKHFHDEGAYFESCMPYAADDFIPCNTGGCTPAADVIKWYYILNDVDYLKAAVMMAPISVCFDVYDDFNYYMSGCYSHVPEEPYDIPISGHCVLITGWDDNICPGGAWRVKNSWDTWWGDEGYFWIKYENNCNFGDMAMLLSINQVEIITDDQLPDASTCLEYNFQFEAIEGTPPYTWKLTFGFPPEGIVMDPSGLFHGKPLESKGCAFGVKVEDDSKPKSQDYLWCSMYIGQTDCACGDTNKDGNIDVADISYLVEFYFNDGPPPSPSANNDFNCDGKIGLDDIVILSKHIINGINISCCQRAIDKSHIIGNTTIVQPKNK